MTERSGEEVPLQLQEAYFTSLINAAREGTPPARILRGPFYAGLQAQADITTHELQALDSSLTPEHIRMAAYRSPAVSRHISAMDSALLDRLNRVRSAHLDRLTSFGGRVVGRALEHQEVSQRELSQPPYVALETPKLCFNAVFRMLFGAIEGWVPAERPLAKTMMELNDGSPIGTDADYLDMFQAPQFRSRVRTAAFVGADLDFIGNFARKLAATKDAPRLFVVVSLGSVVAAGQWHAAVLTGAEGKNVTLLDPDPSWASTGGSRELTKISFATLWAPALNHGHFIIVKDPKEETPVL